jgi:hypothetical protein
VEWFALRHIIKNKDAYEERITLWHADSFEEAITRAEAEANEYAGERSEPLGLYSAYHLFDGPRDGAEVFSLMRRSPLSPSEYLDSYFDTGSGEQKSIES